MSTKTACNNLAAKLGATIHDLGTTLALEAPARHLVDAETHEYVFDVFDGRTGVWRAMWQDLKRFERDGFEACTNTECDWCE